MNRNTLFIEAINHARNKNSMRTFISSLDLPNLLQYTFLEAFQMISSNKPKGIGLLGVYDIASAIARHNNEKLDKVYLVGNGPMRAAKLLSLVSKIKHQKIGNYIIPYLPVIDVISQLKERNITFEKGMDGDQLESFLCNLQKEMKEEEETVCKEIEIDGLTYLYNTSTGDLYNLDCELIRKGDSENLTL
jgi:hypothetical protein